MNTEKFARVCDVTGEGSVEVHTTECHSCGEEVQYTEVLPYCPNCLECLD